MDTGWPAGCRERKDSLVSGAAGAFGRRLPGFVGYGARTFREPELALSLGLCRSWPDVCRIHRSVSHGRSAGKDAVELEPAVQNADYRSGDFADSIVILRTACAHSQ